jgi:N-acyl amino acid synthase of PEP-CTERM/exosortase system
MIAQPITAAFTRYFQVIFADTPELKEEVYRIRYEVYCRELRYEPAENFPDRLEQDIYDERSCHCLLLHRRSGVYAGCVRLVLPDPSDPEGKLPFEDPCAGSLYPDLIEPIFDHRHAVGELSRIAVPEHFRRRKGERGRQVGNMEMPVPKPGELRQFSHIPLGLYLACSAIGVMNGLEGVFAMMEPRLARHLQRFGIIFQQVGQVVDYHGPRAAFYISQETLLRNLNPEVRKLLDCLLADVSTGHEPVEFIQTAR